MNFLKATFIITLYTPISIMFQHFTKKKESQMRLVKKIKEYLNFKLYRVSISALKHQNNIIYFADHRTYADFLIDQITTEYCTKFVSRWITALYLPIYVYLVGHNLYEMVFFFKRGGTSITDFEQLIKKSQVNHAGNNILAYPEGTRRFGYNYASDLKKGLIYYSYKENCPIQFIISKNKEKVFNEKEYTIEKNVDIFVYYSDVYYPDTTKYKSMPEYYEYINSEWKNTFNHVYSTDYQSTKDQYEQLDITKIHDNNYNINTTKLWLVRIGIISVFTVIPAILIKYLY